MFPDNLGWGEVGAYGSVRGRPRRASTGWPREGIRLNNFNVEFSCTVSRAALMTGRYAIRTGATQSRRHHAVGSHDRRSAEVGGLRHGALRQVAPRRRSSRREARALTTRASTSGTAFRARATKRRPRSPKATEDAGHLLTSGRAKRRSPSRNVKPFDLETRRTLDREAADRGIAFMERNVRERKPFFLFYPMTQIHFPTLAHPDFAGKTGAGDIGDAMAEMDYKRRARARRASTGWASRATPSCSGAPTTAPSSGARGADRRDRGAVLQHGDGRRHSHAVHHPLARPHSGGPGVERDRARNRPLSHARRRGRRRHRPEGPRDRWRQPAAVPRRQTEPAPIAST